MHPIHLHIISFNVPYPSNYGGVIDVYYKIKALHSQGVKVHLHCFQYGRKRAKELESICEKVYYYERKMKKIYLLSKLPFIVISRSSELLMRHLLMDDHPILFEGLHTSFYLTDERLKNRVKLVRTHNIEHTYYQELRKVEKSTFKKIYFKEEAKKLKKFESILQHANYILAISKADTEELLQRYTPVHFIGAFHPYNRVKIKEGTGRYCLYQGNLAVAENNESALYLVNEVFSKINIPFIIAGNNPSAGLKKAINGYKHVQLLKNLDDTTMQELIKNAQINVLPAFQGTGIKLKLLAALFTGRHCIVNDTMILNTGLEELCSVKKSAEELTKEIERLFKLPVDSTEIQKREVVLLNHFSNTINAEKIVHLIERE